MTRPPFLFIKLFCCQDGGIALYPPTSPFPQPLQKDNNPSPRTKLASPRKRGGGLTARHKLLLCCVLLTTRPPFYSLNFYAVKTEGLSLHQPFQTRTIPLAFRRASVCVCLYAFTFALSLSLFVGEELAPPVAPILVVSTNLCKRTLITCLTRPSRCT